MSGLNPEGDEPSESPMRGSRGHSCMFWFFGLVLLLLIVVGGIASLGKIGHSPKRFDLPDGGTVEYTDMIVGTTLNYTPGNRVQKLLGRLPATFTKILPQEWLGSGGMSMSFGNGLSAGLVLTAKNRSNSPNVRLQLSDDKGWVTTEVNGGMGVLGVSSSENIYIYQLGLLPHDSPELKVSLFPRKAAGGSASAAPIAEFRVRNPMFNYPPVSSAKVLPLNGEATDGEFTLRASNAVTNVYAKDLKSTDIVQPVRRAKDVEPRCTLVDVALVENGQPTMDYEPFWATVTDVFDVQESARLMKLDNPTGHEFTAKIAKSLPLSSLPYKFGLSFYRCQNFRPDELWTVNLEALTSATASQSVTSNTVMGKLEVYTGGPGYIDSKLGRVKVGRDEYGVYVLESKMLNGHQLQLTTASLSGGMLLEPDVKGSQWINSRTGTGSMMYYWKIRPKFGQVLPVDGVSSVTLTFAIAKVHRMEVVLLPTEPVE